MEAMRQPTSLDPCMRLRRQSQERNSNPPFSLVTKSRGLVALPACFRTPTPFPKAVMATVEKLQRAGNTWSQFLRELPGLSQLWPGDVRKMSRLPDHCRVSLPGLLALPLLPLPATATLPPVLATSLWWRIISCVGNPHSDFWVVGLPALLTRNWAALRGIDTACSGSHSW